MLHRASRIRLRRLCRRALAVGDVLGCGRRRAGRRRGDAAPTAAVRALLKQGVDVNAAQGDGMTALHWAA